MYNNKTLILCRLIFSLIIASALVAQPAAAGWFADTMTDPLDGKIDSSKFLAEEKGFLPVPIIITEPAVGYGLGIAGVFFHDPLAGKTEPGKEFEPNPDADGSMGQDGTHTLSLFSKIEVPIYL